MSSILDTLSAPSRRLLRKTPQPPAPAATAPMLATLNEKHFSDPQWIFERKFDGVRCLAFRGGARAAADDVTLMSRNQKVMNAAFPELVEAVSRHHDGNFVIDGEVVAFDGSFTSFGMLQKRLGIVNPERARKRNVPVVFCLFDILYADGYDVTAVPLVARKKLLKRLIDFRASQILRYSDDRREHGVQYLRDACRDGWEGLIAKRANSPYIHGRSRDWLKFKCVVQQEFVVGGYTDPQRSRLGFGALLVGYYDRKGNLHYAGKVGTGYDDATLMALGEHMKKIERAEPPFADEELLRDRSVKGAHWIRPNLVAQVGFTEWTHDGRLRHPRFLGLRHDKPARNVVRERPVR